MLRGPVADADRPVAIRLVRVHVPLLAAHRSAHGVDRLRDVVLVEWHLADGTLGWGECPTVDQPGYSTETTDAAWRGLRDDLGPAALARRTPRWGGLVAASAALADAGVDAALRRGGRSLVDELGADARTLGRCVVLADLGVSPRALAERALEAIGGGADMVKLKIAPGVDVEPLAAVIAAIGIERVAADANGSYGSPEDLAAVDELGLVYLEQPVAAGATWDELAALRHVLRTPVALDESLTSLDAVRDAVRRGAVDVVSVKPARLGGVRAAAMSVELAREAGLDAFVGGMLELGIGRATSAAVAALPGCSLPTDLGPSDRYVAVDVTEPVVVDGDGRLVVPLGPGCGREPLPEVLSRCTVDEVLLRR